MGKEPEKERGIRIGTIGHVGAGNIAFAQAMKNIEQNDRVIIVGKQTREKEVFVINGKSYVRKTVPNNQLGIDHFYVKQFEEMQSLIYQGKSSNSNRIPPKTNIIKEFGLIQNKQSKFSAKQRELIVKEFNKYFEEVKP